MNIVHYVALAVRLLFFMTGPTVDQSEFLLFHTIVSPQSLCEFVSFVVKIIEFPGSVPDILNVKKM